MAMGEWPPPPGYIWNDAIGWHWGGCCCCFHQSSPVFPKALIRSGEVEPDGDTGLRTGLAPKDSADAVNHSLPKDSQQ